MSGISAFVLNLSKSSNILFRSMLCGNCLFSSASLSLVGDNSQVHEPRVMQLLNNMKMQHITPDICIEIS